MRSIRIQTYNDGNDEPFGFAAIREAWLREWNACYGGFAALSFLPLLNLKHEAVLAQAPRAVRRLSEVRNPDLFFVETSENMALGGVEITAHSPDGSNIDKRYPFLWAARRLGLDAFVATPYAKRRANGSVNKLPHRHALRNLSFMEEFLRDPGRGLRQFIPLRPLHGAQDFAMPPELRAHLWEWDHLGRYFAHALAEKILTAGNRDAPAQALAHLAESLRTLARECVANTQDTEPSTLLRLPGRWVQVYNARPDSGHWERGEGQFDSIDGRLMFTLDDLHFSGSSGRTRFEFWLPQMVSAHPWIAEQRMRGFASKRLRNILVALADECRTKFADDLSASDWKLLRDNSHLVLERLDWAPGILRVTDLMGARSPAEVARIGMRGAARSEIDAIAAMLADGNLYFSTHRAYKDDWQADFLAAYARLPGSATLLVPRIPAALLDEAVGAAGPPIVAAEHCTRAQLRMLRQLHRSH